MSVNTIRDLMILAVPRERLAAYGDLHGVIQWWPTEVHRLGQLLSVYTLESVGAAYSAAIKKHVEERCVSLTPGKDDAHYRAGKRALQDVLGTLRLELEKNPDKYPALVRKDGTPVVRLSPPPSVPQSVRSEHWWQSEQALKEAAAAELEREKRHLVLVPKVTP